MLVTDSSFPGAFPDISNPAVKYNPSKKSCIAFQRDIPERATVQADQGTSLRYAQTTLGKTTHFIEETVLP